MLCGEMFPPFSVSMFVVNRLEAVSSDSCCSGQSQLHMNSHHRRVQRVSVRTMYYGT